MYINDLIFLAPERDFLKKASGQFARQVLVLNLSEPDFPQNKDFLEKVFTAAKVNFNNDTLYCELPEDAVFSLLSAIKQKQATKVLIFGLDPRQLGLSIQFHYYQPFEFCGATYLFAEKLSVLEPDRERKGHLWAALKAMFL